MHKWFLDRYVVISSELHSTNEPHLVPLNSQGKKGDLHRVRIHFQKPINKQTHFLIRFVY